MASYSLLSTILMTWELRYIHSKSSSLKLLRNSCRIEDSESICLAMNGALLLTLGKVLLYYALTLSFKKMSLITPTKFLFSTVPISGIFILIPRATSLNYAIILSYLVAGAPLHMLEIHTEALFSCISRYISLYAIENDAFLYLLTTGLNLTLTLGIDSILLAGQFLNSFVKRYVNHRDH